MIRNLKNIAFYLTKKYIDEDSLECLSICIEKEKINYFNLSTNQIISFVYDGQLYYFRECPKVKSFKEYITNGIREFFLSLDRLGISEQHFKQPIPICLTFTVEEVNKFQEYIELKVCEKSFIKKLRKIDVISKKCAFSIWTERSYDKVFFECFGMSELPENLYNIGVLFLWHMRSTVLSYKTHKIVRGNMHSFFSATKAFSSRIVAEELGLAHMITNYKWCKLRIDNQEEKLGLLSESAPGARMLDVKVDLCGALQKELTNLNILDMICYQVDHGPNNYNVYNNYICAFDNDNPVTFFPLPIIKHNKIGGVYLIDSRGYISRPYLDEKLVERLKKLNKHILKKRLRPYLNTIQVNSMFHRINLLKKAIDLTYQSNNNFLINDEEWNLETVEQEMSGKYGMTYLTKLINK